MARPRAARPITIPSRGMDSELSWTWRDDGALYWTSTGGLVRLRFGSGIAKLVARAPSCKCDWSIELPPVAGDGFIATAQAFSPRGLFSTVRSGKIVSVLEPAWYRKSWPLVQGLSLAADGRRLFIDWDDQSHAYERFYISRWRFGERRVITMSKGVFGFWRTPARTLKTQ